MVASVSSVFSFLPVMKRRRYMRREDRYLRLLASPWDYRCCWEWENYSGIDIRVSFLEAQGGWEGGSRGEWLIIKRQWSFGRGRRRRLPTKELPSHQSPHCSALAFPSIDPSSLHMVFCIDITYFPPSIYFQHAIANIISDTYIPFSPFSFLYGVTCHYNGIQAWRQAC